MIILWLSTLCLAGIQWDGAPVQGEPTVLAVTNDSGTPIQGETARVVYREGLAASEEVAVGITDNRGQVSWTPERGGTAIIFAGDRQRRVAIRYDRVPMDTAGTLGLVFGLCLASFAFGTTRRRP